MNSPGAFQIFLPYARSNQRNKANESLLELRTLARPRGLERVFDLRCLEGRRFAASALRLRASRSMKTSACGHTNVSLDVFAYGFFVRCD
jgi:hypothetical protein